MVIARSFQLADSFSKASLNNFLFYNSPPYLFCRATKFSYNRTRQTNLSILFYSTRSFFVGVTQLDHNVRLISVDQIRQQFYFSLNLFPAVVSLLLPILRRVSASRLQTVCCLFVVNRPSNNREITITCI